MRKCANISPYMRRSLVMTLHLLHSEFPYIWGKFYFFLSVQTFFGVHSLCEALLGEKMSEHLQRKATFRKDNIIFLHIQHKLTLKTSLSLQFLREKILNFSQIFAWFGKLSWEDHVRVAVPLFPRVLLASSPPPPALRLRWSGRSGSSAFIIVRF